jgi:hypothetical protein
MWGSIGGGGSLGQNVLCVYIVHRYRCGAGQNEA